MEFRDADETEICLAIEAFYKKRLSLSDKAVFWTVQPMTAPVDSPGGPFWINLSILDSQFLEEEQDADSPLMERLTIQATAFTKIQVDRSGRETKMLFDPQRGTSALKKKLLLIVGEPLLDSRDRSPLASRVYAIGSGRPNYDAEQAIGWRSVTLGVEWSWCLDGASDLGED